MKPHIQNGIVLTAFGAVSIVLMYGAGIGLPFQGETTSVRGGLYDVPTIMVYGLAAAFLVVGILSLLDLYPGWGLKTSRDE